MRYRLAFLAMVVASMLAGCDGNGDSALASEQGSSGRVSVTLTLGKIGVFGRTAGNTRNRLCLEFLSDRGETIRDTLAIYASLGTLNKFYTLPANQDWTLTAKGYDASDSLLYQGTTAFAVNATRTTDVRLAMSAKYSTLRIRFPVIDSISRLVVTVDGVVRGDSSFAKQSGVGSVVTVSVDHLAATPSGTPHTIGLSAYGGSWGLDTLLYALDTVVSLSSGTDGNIPMVLRWVGPRTPPAGSANLVVNLGAIGVMDIHVNPVDSADRIETFTDPRDGEIYSFREIGGRRWMLSNMGATCAGCDSSGTDFDELAIVAACPLGWHVPDSAEWRSLVVHAAQGGDLAAGAYHLRSASANWSDLESSAWTRFPGDDAYGFRLLPSMELSDWMTTKFPNIEYSVERISVLWTSSRSEPMALFDHSGFALPRNPVSDLYGNAVSSAKVRCIGD